MIVEFIALVLFVIFLTGLLYWWWYDNHKWVVEFNGSKFYFKTKEKAEKFVTLQRELWVSVAETREKLDNIEEAIRQLKASNEENK